MTIVGKNVQDIVGIKDRSRHQNCRLTTGIAKHNSLISSPLILASRGVNTLSNIGRLGMQSAINLDFLPIKSLLLVSYIANRLAGQLVDVSARNILGTPSFPDNPDKIGCGYSFNGGTGKRINRQKSIDQSIRNPVTKLIRMPFRHRFACKNVIF